MWTQYFAGKHPQNGREFLLSQPNRAYAGSDACQYAIPLQPSPRNRRPQTVECQCPDQAESQSAGPVRARGTRQPLTRNQAGIDQAYEQTGQSCLVVETGGWIR